MLIFILIDVQKAVFSFEKGSTGQNHPSSSSHQPAKSPPSKISDFPHPLTPFERLPLMFTKKKLPSIF